MKKLIYALLLSLIGQHAYAGIQNSHDIPDAIVLRNSLKTAIEVNDEMIAPGHEVHLPGEKSFKIKLDHCNTIQDHSYIITCPTYNKLEPILEVYTTAYLDAATIPWLARDNKKEITSGLDEVSITNDTLYKIAIVYTLNKVRTSPRTIEPQETVSKVISNRENNDAKVHIYIKDQDQKTYTVTLPRRLYDGYKYMSCVWQSATLCASTIKWFGNGFKATVQ
jgi:hypothetical protein